MAEGERAAEREGGEHSEMSAEVTTPRGISVDAIVERVLERLGREGVQPVTPTGAGEGSSSSRGLSGGE